jgi:transposase-like protein
VTRSRRQPRCRRSGGFQPPCCPNPTCPFHGRREDWHFIRFGFFRRPADGRRIQCYRCTHCGRRFSNRTFSTTYWLQRRDLLAQVARMISEGSALRQIARVLDTHHKTVARMVARLGRHCLLFHTRQLGSHALSRPLVVDGFETFEYSQYFPFHINLAIGSESWFLFHFTASPLRRKGRMTAAQRRRRAQLEARWGRPDPKAVEQGMRALLEALLPRMPLAPGVPPLVLHSDDHPAYCRALARLRRDHPRLRFLRHQVTSSRARRTRRNPLFPVNLADLLLRHGNANHRRETIAFSKRRQAALERTAVFAVWRNYVKRRVENGPRQTAAMMEGVIDRVLRWPEILRRRLFPAHFALPPPWPRYYARGVRTAVLGERQTAHTCRYAW